MGASASARRDGSRDEEEEEESADAKLLQTNGQISGVKETEPGEQSNGPAEEKELQQVGQTEAVSQKEDNPETMEPLEEEVATHVNGEKETTCTESKGTSTEKISEEEKPEESNEVGFKKIFRFVGFKFTVKKEKNEKVEPVQLLTVKKEEGEASGSDVVQGSTENNAIKEIKPEEDQEASEERQAEKQGDESPQTDKEAEREEATDQTLIQAPEPTKEPISPTAESTQEITPEKETEPTAESPTSPASQSTQSSLRRFFTQGLFSNLRKKASFKKSKEEEAPKEKIPEEETKLTEETAQSLPVEGEKVTAEVSEVSETQQEQTPDPEKKESELPPETAVAVVVEQKEDEITLEIKSDDITQTTSDEVTETLPTEISVDAVFMEEKVNDAAESDAKTEEVPTAVTNEVELLSSQEKNKVHGSPLKKLLTGSGLKKLSSKRQKTKKEAETKLTESGEYVSEQLQSSSESAEVHKGESSPSSTEESTEHAFGESGQAEAGHESEGDAATSDGEKKKDGILPWSSFKKLVTPKKRVKRPSESEDEASEKPKTATMSSTESATSAERQDESKQSEEEQKTDHIIEEPKKKIDTSVSWEALICVGSAKKRARKASDSDEEAPRIEEENPTLGEEHIKPIDSPLGNSVDTEQENQLSPEKAGTPEADGVSTWESLKRFVTPRRKAKSEDKEESTEQIPSDSELPKEESTFSLKKLLPGRKKKKSDGKQASIDEAGKDVASAEEDSDTPAVVPLSEYDAEQTEKVETPRKGKSEATETQTDIIENEKSKTDMNGQDGKTVNISELVDVTNTPLKASVSAEERSPSWISATVVEEIQETTECITKQQLSDIPEEGDTATAKSTEEEASRDDTIAEDIVELKSEAVTTVEPVPEVSCEEEKTEMVSVMSRLTGTPKTSGNITPVQAEYDMEKTEAILQEAVQPITVTENVQVMTMTDLQPETIPVSQTPQVLESASSMTTVTLVPHQKLEATAICTGLVSEEMIPVEETSLKTCVESLTEASQAVSTELAVESKADKPEVAEVGEDHVFAVKVMEVKTELVGPLPIPEVKEKPKEDIIEVGIATELQEKEILYMGEVKDVPPAELSNEIEEVSAINVALVNVVTGESKKIEQPIVTEITPEIETEGPLEEIVENTVHDQPLHVTEVCILDAGEVQEFEGIKEEATLFELAPAEEVVQCVSEDMTTTMSDTIIAQSSEVQETQVAVVATEAECPETRETISISTSIPSQRADVKKELFMERLPSLTRDGHEIQVEVTSTDIQSPEVCVEACIEASSTTVAAVAQEVCEEVKDVPMIEAKHEEEPKIIQEECSIVVQQVLQNVVAQVIPEEVTETLPDTTLEKTNSTKEPEIAVVAPTIDIMESQECLNVNKADFVHPTMVEMDEVVAENVSSAKFSDDYQIQAELNETDMTSAETLVETDIKVVLSTVTPIVKDVCDQPKDVDLEQVQHDSEAKIIQEQSTAIVREVIQAVVEDLSEDICSQAPESIKTEDAEAMTVEDDKGSQDISASDVPIEKEMQATDESSSSGETEKTVTKLEQPKIMVLEATSVETVEVIQCESIGVVAPAGINQEDITVESEVRCRDVYMTPEEAEVRVQELDSVDMKRVSESHNIRKSGPSEQTMFGEEEKDRGDQAEENVSSIVSSTESDTQPQKQETQEYLENVGETAKAEESQVLDVVTQEMKEEIEPQTVIESESLSTDSVKEDLLKETAIEKSEKTGETSEKAEVQTEGAVICAQLSEPVRCESQEGVQIELETTMEFVADAEEVIAEVDLIDSVVETHFEENQEDPKDTVLSEERADCHDSVASAEGVSVEKSQTSTVEDHDSGVEAEEVTESTTVEVVSHSEVVQVSMEVIMEAVKEMEPVTSELTAAS